jgi:hypothetical protein
MSDLYGYTVDRIVTVNSRLGFNCNSGCSHFKRDSITSLSLVHCQLIRRSFALAVSTMNTNVQI